MAFITTQDGICLSEEGLNNFSPCGPIIKEQDPATYVFTESSLSINTDNECGNAQTQFDCSFERKIVSSGIVNITNTCTLPITITGLVNSDPIRFSLFDYPKYKNNTSIYSIENTQELPVTLSPLDTLKIPTFFHPSIDELINGNAGEIQDLDNQIYEVDVFGARVDIYPGFPISNCSTEELSCDAFFTLTGQLLCEDSATDLDWMNNLENFVESKNLSEFKNDIQIQECIKSTPGVKAQVDPWSSEEELIDRIKQTAVAYLESITNGKKNLEILYSHAGMYGAIKGFVKLIEDSSFSTINQLKSANLSKETIIYSYQERGGFASQTMQVSMDVEYNQQVKSVTIDEVTFDGMLFSVNKQSGSLDARNQTIFFAANQSDNSILFLTAEEGDYESNNICDQPTATITIETQEVQEVTRCNGISEYLPIDSEGRICAIQVFTYDWPGSISYHNWFGGPNAEGFDLPQITDNRGTFGAGIPFGINDNRENKSAFPPAIEYSVSGGGVIVKSSYIILPDSSHNLPTPYVRSSVSGHPGYMGIDNTKQLTDDSIFGGQFFGTLLIPPGWEIVVFTGPNYTRGGGHPQDPPAEYFLKEYGYEDDINVRFSVKGPCVFVNYINGDRNEPMLPVSQQIKDSFLGQQCPTWTQMASIRNIKVVNGTESWGTTDYWDHNNGYHRYDEGGYSYLLKKSSL